MSAENTTLDTAVDSSLQNAQKPAASQMNGIVASNRQSESVDQFVLDDIKVTMQRIYEESEKRLNPFPVNVDDHPHAQEVLTSDEEEDNQQQQQQQQQPPDADEQKNQRESFSTVPPTSLPGGQNRVVAGQEEEDDDGFVAYLLSWFGAGDSASSATAGRAAESFADTRKSRGKHRRDDEHLSSPWTRADLSQLSRYVLKYATYRELTSISRKMLLIGEYKKAMLFYERACGSSFSSVKRKLNEQRQEELQEQQQQQKNGTTVQRTPRSRKEGTVAVTNARRYHNLQHPASDQIYDYNDSDESDDSDESEESDSFFTESENEDEAERDNATAYAPQQVPLDYNTVASVESGYQEDRRVLNYQAHQQRVAHRRKQERQQLQQYSTMARLGLLAGEVGKAQQMVRIAIISLTDSHATNAEFFDESGKQISMLLKIDEKQTGGKNKKAYLRWLDKIKAAKELFDAPMIMPDQLPGGGQQHNSSNVF